MYVCFIITATDEQFLSRIVILKLQRKDNGLCNKTDRCITFWTLLLLFHVNKPLYKVIYTQIYFILFYFILCYTHYFNSQLKTIKIEQRKNTHTE